MWQGRGSRSSKTIRIGISSIRFGSATAKTIVADASKSALKWRNRMNHRTGFLSKLAALAVLFSSVICQADPCGMVPPITIGPTVPLVRIGDQHTYVFYKDGIETIVLRPGFSGKVDEFGMLIPFPSPPAIRKVSDDIFPHIAAAIDPPEVVVQAFRRLYRFSAAAPMSNAAESEGLKFDAVRVISQEAVGMYEVAVLEAGSAKALQRWMDDHQYKYPKGMDAACEDYVDEGWCFAAIKTRVGQKQAADPRPGQKNIDVTLPEGANFEGHVQAMGFRFRVDKMVVPMRLSTFNEGDLHNIVYILTDKPARIANLSSDLVVRQLPGEQLFKNVTDLLPLRVIGQKITEQLIKQQEPQRDPTPKNGAAKELFASDLLAVSNGELALPHEEQEKALLSISESLGLRGKEIDAVHAVTLERERKATIDAAIEGVKKMTLTVVDGDFPRDVLARENLTFSDFAMDAAANSPEKYDAKLKAAPPKRSGTLHLGHSAPQSPLRAVGFTIGSLFVSLGMIGLVLSPRRRVTLPVLLVGLTAWSSTAEAQVLSQEKFSELASERLVELFDDRANASYAAAELVHRGTDVQEILLETANSDSNLTQRGWAISCLGRIGGRDAEIALAKIYHNDREEKLVRNWAAAARIAATNSAELLIEQAQLVQEFPALGRPLAKKLVANLNKGQQVSAAQLIGITLKVPALQTALAEPILAAGSASLVNVLTTATDQNVRRQAAAYLGTLASQSSGVPEAVVAAYAFDSKATNVPWSDGPLFVPRLSWPQEKARTLVGNLIRWHVWCDINNHADEQQQIHNNLRSLYLAGAAGYQSPGFRESSTAEWLKIWSAVVGNAEVKKLLAEQDVSPRKYGF